MPTPSVYRNTDSPVTVNENSVDQLFKTLEELKKSKDARDKATQEHLDKINTVNLESMNNYVQGSGMAMKVDPKTNTVVPFDYTEKRNADAAKEAIRRSRITQAQEFQDLITRHTTPSSSNDLQVATAAGMPVMKSQTAMGGPDMEPVPNANALPPASQAGRMRTNISIDKTGNPTMTMSETEPNPLMDELAKERMELSKTNRQDKLEKYADDTIKRVLSNRSGGLGLQDAKVNSSVHALNILDQSFDPKTGEVKVPPQIQADLAANIANTISGTSVTSEQMRQELQFHSVYGDWNKTMQYLTGLPKNTLPKDMFKYLAETIVRQGRISQKLRDNYIDKSKELFPSGLNPETKERLKKVNISNDFEESLKNSPVYNHFFQDKVTVVDPSGKTHQINKSSLSAAMKKYPGLKVKE